MFGVVRYEQCTRFLRQYDLIGMPRVQVVSLLGPPDGLLDGTQHAFYRVRSGCTGAELLVLKYEGEKVSAYGAMHTGNPEIKWFTVNAKPDANDFTDIF